MITFYGYSKCSTCQKAKKYLNGKKIRYKEVDITMNPPSRKVIQTILQGKAYTLEQLFNRSGLMYRELKMKDKMPTMSKAALINLLANNGRLVKRPIILNGGSHTVGFDEKVFKKTWK
tara:strand:- start:1164 stop:1517 length:354 start_codon:yes stop_codon:yes gene_type:complete